METKKEGERKKKERNDRGSMERNLDREREGEGEEAKKSTLDKLFCSPFNYTDLHKDV